MSISVNTNIASMVAQKSLTRASKDMNRAMERMSTGYRINSSQDDAAGMAVSSKLNFKANSFDVAQSNGQIGASMLNVAEGIYNVINDNLERIRVLTEQASNGVYGSDSMTAISSEVQVRMNEITRLSISTEFNGIFLMNGSVGVEGINLQIGIYKDVSSSAITLTQDLFADASATSLLGSEDCSAHYQDDSTAREFLENIDNAIANITARVTQIGSVQQRISSAVDAVEIMQKSTIEAASNIQDADVASESTSFVKNQILQQIATSMLTTANQTPAIALSLIGG